LGADPGSPLSLQSASPGRFTLVTQHLAARVFSRSKRVRRKFANIGEIADYVDWLREHFGDVHLAMRREEVWEALASRVHAERVLGMEFGVAWGYGSGWWLERLPSRQLHWDGFDRFTGLPRAWRDLDSGHFDAGGNTPDIDDDRVTWHVGDVEDHLADLDLDRTTPGQAVVLFDLDIFEPSLAAWNHIRGSLRPGDLLYFDEAFDLDERRLLTDHVLPSGSFEFVAATPLTLGLAVTQLADP
jgi:hypothetical protein